MDLVTISMVNLKKNKEILKKYGIPTAELLWCQYYNNDNLTHIVTSGITREQYFLYEIKEGAGKKIGKNKNPTVFSKIIEEGWGKVKN